MYCYGENRLNPIKCVLNLRAGSDEIITEAGVGSQEIGFNASWWFYGHLRAILQNGHREPIARQTSQPKTEVPMDLRHKCLHTKIK